MGKIGLTKCLAVFINALDLDLTMTSSDKPGPFNPDRFSKNNIAKTSVETLFLVQTEYLGADLWFICQGS